MLKLSWLQHHYHEQWQVTVGFFANADLNAQLASQPHRDPYNGCNFYFRSNWYFDEELC